MLTPRQRQHLKAKAHALKPVLHVGKLGITPALAAEIDLILESHELIKVKLNKNSSEDEPAVVEALKARVDGIEHVWTIGHTLLFFRASRERPSRFPLPD